MDTYDNEIREKYHNFLQAYDNKLDAKKRTKRHDADCYNAFRSHKLRSCFYAIECIEKMIKEVKQDLAEHFLFTDF